MEGLARAEMAQWESERYQNDGHHSESQEEHAPFTLRLDGDALLALVDQLKNKLGAALILLGGELDGKITLVAGVTQNLTAQLKAGDLMKQAAAAVGGKGGGRPDMARGGGTEVAKLDEALALAKAYVEQTV